MDFIIKTYCKLLDALQKQGFTFQTFAEFIEKPVEKVIILRQDVDRLPENSLQFARIQEERGIIGTYYFRVMPESWDEEIIREIYALGHEVGYHYEDMNWCAVRGMRYAESDLVKIAIKSFAENLEKLRKIVPVKTICMHGSPMSKWDSRLLWKYYDYHDFNLIGEPYFDVDFNEVLYLTDTGRRWDGDLVNIRDKRVNHKEDKGYTKYTKEKQPATSNQQPATSDSKPGTLNLGPRTSSKFHSTFDIINSAEESKLPAKIMMTFHPQRWTDKPLAWLRELVWQNLKNPAKYFLVKCNNIYSK